MVGRRNETGTFPDTCGRSYVAGLPVNVTSRNEVVAAIRSAAGSRRPLRIHTLNVDHVVLAHRHPTFARVIASADLVVPDGMPIVWTLRHRGFHAERITGADLVEYVLRELAVRVVLVGGQPGVAFGVAELAQRLKWKATIIGTFAPRRADVLDSSWSTELAQEIRALRPDVIFVGFGAPLQELWLARHSDELDVAVQMGVGAAFDFLGGHVRRAPPFMREHGLEWLYRLIQDPLRLGVRYVGRDWRFVLLVSKYGSQPMLAGSKMTDGTVDVIEDLGAHG